MLLSSSQQFIAGPSNSSMSLYSSQMQPNFGFNPVQGASLQNPLAATTDQNSPALFKQNLAIVQQEILKVQALARDALSGIQSAYHIGQSPATTSRQIEKVRLALDNLMQLLRSTGVGALPVLPSAGTQGEPITPPTEAQLLVDANKSIQTLYESLKRKQESAAVVANLLGADNRTGGR
ncbi:hypothetical protein EST38_g5119 [Candolleomyces aberdarensis]|uniref:Uncharacterized protein n=1 Tax=Candolleomyces aberdarensis TaxID=2316362 RepID=A0A4Q2DLC7_9AGAR|nr:hypothetical protein EST38_g5119 [Candolleomyces aberdarensis]